MELQYIVLTIIKILISVPTLVFVVDSSVDGAALIGGHVDNANNNNAKIIASVEESNETNAMVPDPEKLVVPGYNLPERIFNKGKPFYLEKDPLTGNVDFNSKTEMYDEMDDGYEYEDGIDRKDGPAITNTHHKSSDINQLTPNFHDFLNLPVKYNPDKYVYPLISSSYANTKVQGNVNKHQNHKNYIVTTYKPTLSPTYFTTKQFHTQNKVIEFTSKPPNERRKATEPMGTTTTSTTSTKRPMSLFEELFGTDYEDAIDTTTTTSTEGTTHKNILSGTNMGYEYEEEQPAKVSQVPEEYDYDYNTEKTTLPNNVPLPSSTPSTTTTTTTTTRTTTVPSNHQTSLPIGENHIHTNNKQQSTKIIVTSQNLRDQLNGEKVPLIGDNKESFIHPHATSTSNIRIAPDQDTVSFVMGNHQSVEGYGSPNNGAYVGTSLKESPYESNPFRPVYEADGTNVVIPSKPGKVVDDLEFNDSKKNRIVFPDNVQQEKSTIAPSSSTTGSISFSGDLIPPPPSLHKEVLKLSSKPMFHQLPSELTPPNKEAPPGRVRPPWDPRPGHFQTGRPEYVRPPRPQPPQSQKPEMVYKRVDNLPNILPQFRPNANNNHQRPPPMMHHGPHPHVHPVHPVHHPNNNRNYARQPLLERPSNNRPIGFFEKYQHGPPNMHVSKIAPKVAEDRIISNSNVKDIHQQQHEPFSFLQPPPKVVVSNRRQDPETLQMIQAKQEQKKQPIFVEKSKINATSVTVEKPLYVVYPVNSSPIKLDALSGDNKKESVVIGTRAELPLPPSKIIVQKENGDEFEYKVKERHDSPILKPRPSSVGGSSAPIVSPVKSDFPYPLERPDPSILLSPDISENKLRIEEPFSSNQWNTIEDSEARIVTNNNKQSPNQISVTLKTGTSERPIAVAYTPTQPPLDKFSMPNYASLVIPEIRDSEITVGAVMRHEQPSSTLLYHHHHQQQQQHREEDRDTSSSNGDFIKQGEFQAPFQASAHIDQDRQSVVAQGWAVVRDKEAKDEEEGGGGSSGSTQSSPTGTQEFDIENFKPQLEGGFKPIYNYPQDDSKDDSKADNVRVNEREERRLNE